MYMLKLPTAIQTAIPEQKCINVLVVTNVCCSIDTLKSMLLAVFAHFEPLTVSIERQYEAAMIQTHQIYAFCC